VSWLVLDHDGDEWLRKTGQPDAGFDDLPGQVDRCGRMDGDPPGLGLFDQQATTCPPTCCAMSDVP
jgi:hypothetical protein